MAASKKASPKELRERSEPAKAAGGAVREAKPRGAKSQRKKAAPASKTKAAAKKPAAKKKAAPKVAPRRADYGAPIDGFFAKQSPQLRPIAEALRKLVEEAAPEASASLKWGMPFYTIGTGMMCAIAGHKSHVNLILAGDPEAYADPDGLLEGEAKNGRHLKLRSLDALPTKAVRGWLKTAVKLATAG